jgi:hypothetical protein
VRKIKDNKQKNLRNEDNDKVAMNLLRVEIKEGVFCNFIVAHFRQMLKNFRSFYHCVNGTQLQEFIKKFFC